MAEIKLADIRKQIDAIDQQLQDLINQRAQCALEVAKIKQQDKKNPVYYRPEREAQIIRKIMQRNPGPLSEKDISEIFLFILAKCRALQQPLKIAIVGARKNIDHQAAGKHFGAAIQETSAKSIADIFYQVIEHRVNYGVVPIENSKEGVVNATLDALIKFSTQICGEIQMPISKKDSTDTTRFLIIGNDAVAPSGIDKTSLLISITNRPGSLAKIFQPFANHQVNITFFESRPYRDKMWNYVFFVDIDGHQQDQNVQQALAELSTQPLTYTILGSYPKAVP